MAPAVTNTGAIKVLSGTLNLSGGLTNSGSGIMDPARGAGERVLYSLHVMARVGLWFAFALFFVGSALSEEPAGLRWYVLVLIALAGVQMLTTLALGRGGGSRP